MKMASLFSGPIFLCAALCCQAQVTSPNDISSIIPPGGAKGDIVLPSGVFSGELRIQSSARISAKTLGDFVLRGRIVIDGASDVTIENVVVDGSRPAAADGKDPKSTGEKAPPPLLLDIRKAKNLRVANCSLFAFDQPSSPEKTQTPSMCDRPFWDASGIKIVNSESIVMEGVRVATQSSRVMAYKSKNVKIVNCDFCAAAAIGSQYKLFLRSSNVYYDVFRGATDVFFDVSGLSFENNVFRAASRNHFVLSLANVSDWSSDRNIFWGMVKPPADCGGDQRNTVFARTLPLWRELSGRDLNSKTARIDYIADGRLGFKRDPAGVLTGKPNISIPLPDGIPGGCVSVGIFSGDGSLARTLIAEYEPKGMKSLGLHWDGTDNLRHPVPPGRYVVRAIAPNLKVEQSWIANSFGTFEEHIQQEIAGIATAPDGTTFGICKWDEAGAEMKRYTVDGKSDFKFNPQLHGWGRFGSSEITADEKYIYAAVAQSGNSGGDYPNKNKNGLFKFPPKENIWECVRRYDLEGRPVPFPEGCGYDGSMLMLREFPGRSPCPACKGTGKLDNPDASKKEAVSCSKCKGTGHISEEYANISGLAASGGKLFVADCKQNKIRSFDRDTMKELQGWNLPDPGRMAYDGKGSLLVLNRKDGAAVSKIPVAGGTVSSLSLPEAGKASSLVFDPKGRLLVADDGPDMQVKMYDVSGDSPKLVDTLGQKGGIYAGAPGLVAPDKFNGITGVGCDSSGSIYVSSTRSGGELRKFSPGKKLQWHLLGLAFVDGASADPESPEDVFMKDEHFKMDYSAHPAKWEYVGYTKDIRKPEPFNYRNLVSNLVRQIDGKRFMFCSYMYPQGGLAIFKFDGEIALPSGFVKMDNTHDAKLWRDTNGDGVMDDSECQNPKSIKASEAFVITNGSWHWFVDSKGDIWKAYNAAGILRIPCRGLDDKGNPIYDLEKAESFPMPAPFIEINTVEYMPETNTLFVGGETEESKRNKGDGWGPTTRFIARYDNKTKLRWLVPVDTICCNAISVSSNIVVATDVMTAQAQMFDAFTGLKLGTAAVGKPVGYHSGWTDFPMCVRAMTLKNGETVVFVEEDSCAKIMLYRVGMDSKRVSESKLILDDKGELRP